MAITQSVESVGANVSYQTFGTTTPSKVLPNMLVAACGDASVLSRVSFPYISMDLRGTGGSRVNSIGKETFRLTSYMADFENVIQNSQVRRISLFGYSHGGYFTTAYALAKPKCVSAMVLVEPALFTEREELLRRANLAGNGDAVESLNEMIRYVDPQMGLNIQSAVNMSESIMENYQEAQALAAEFMVRADHPIGKRELASLKMPVLLIGGTESHANYTVKEAAALIPNASVWWIEGANHFDLMSAEYTGEISSIVDLFVSRYGGGC